MSNMNTYCRHWNKLIDHVLMVSWRIMMDSREKGKERNWSVRERERGGQRARVKGMLHAN